MTTHPNHHAQRLRTRLPGSGLLLLATILIVFFAIIAVLDSPAQAKTLKVTNKENKGPGSLRYAISHAAPKDTITFASGVRGIITLGDEIEISKTLTIRGPGADKLALSGNNRHRVFYIDSGKIVKMSDLTITKGYEDFSDGGGIYNEGNLRLTECIVRGNYADYAGGGIYNDNVLTLVRTVVSSNSSDYFGGGIYNDYGTVIVGSSTISGNTAGEDGGGIYSDTDSPGRTTITNSTISGNSANSAYSAGGGIYNDVGLTEIRNSTITNNTAPEGASVGDSYDVATTKVFSTIIALNYGKTWSMSGFNSEGYNIVGSGQSNVARKFNKTGDQVAVSNPGLGVLADNGGPTRTHRLLSGSPAINTGSPNCPPPATDQRGVKRPQGGRCDKGSFERAQP